MITPDELEAMGYDDFADEVRTNQNRRHADIDRLELELREERAAEERRRREQYRLQREARRRKI